MIESNGNSQNKIVFNMNYVFSLQVLKTSKKFVVT